MIRQELLDALDALPEGVNGEIIHDTLYTSARPAAPHSRAASVLGGLLSGPFDRGRDGPGGWVILDEPELLFDDAILIPDLGGWRRPFAPDTPEAARFTRSPDWLCEVLSPSTARLDRTKKLPRYARAGVGHVWLIDPIAQTLETFELDAGSWRLRSVHSGEDLLRAAPFDAIALELAELWRW